VEGPARGTTIPLEGDVTLGRDPSNTLALPDTGASRFHCAIRLLDGAVWVEDLESRNGTMVNGAPVSRLRLEVGDEVRIGATALRLVDGTEAAISGTIVLRTEDAAYLGRAAMEPSPRSLRDLRVLLEFSRAVHSADSGEALHEKLVDLVLRALPADRAALVLFDDADPDVATVLARDRDGDVRSPNISRTVLGRVLEDRVAVLSNEVERDATLAEAESLVMRLVSSVIAVPLVLRDRVMGMLYAESDDDTRAFRQADLELITALGNIASLAMRNVGHAEALAGENQRLRGEIDLQHDIVGSSASVRDLLHFIGRVAKLDSTVLVWGESGTGKELVARAIHRNSARADKPFVAINCAAITETLLESELFGHERGSFTGATGQKKGKIEVADGGTLFLDEVGEMSPLLQAKLLRVIQEREFERVGGTKPIKANVRIVAATNRDLAAMSKTGQFRQDLFYRLNVVAVKTTPLRDRRDDIAVLASHFIQRFSEQTKRAVAGLSSAARACLLRYDWPGNIRELQNALERAVVLGNSDTIQPSDLPESVLESAPTEGGGTAMHDLLNEAKRQIIQRAIAEADNNYTEAAHRLGIHPNHLFRLVRTLDLTPKRRRAGA
jgi:Nif-specific regulatory protein